MMSSAIEGGWLAATIRVLLLPFLAKSLQPVGEARKEAAEGTARPLDVVVPRMSFRNGAPESSDAVPGSSADRH